jgi:hypothetical protein
MKRIVFAFSLLAACGTSNPSKPAIGGTQIDRMGRAAVNTALTNPFAFVSGKTTDQSKDEYNAAKDPATWSASFQGEIKTHLAIFDGIDGNCGNQLAASGTLDANRYSALAGVLADDQLYVRTDKTTCALYLGAEANFVGVTNSDCGGRTPVEDTIKETYSLLVIGATSGITDGLGSADADGNANATTFPFLGAPH